MDSPKVQNLISGSRHSFYLTHAVTAEEAVPGSVVGSTPSAEDSPVQDISVAERARALRALAPA